MLTSKRHSRYSKEWEVESGTSVGYFRKIEVS